MPNLRKWVEDTIGVNMDFPTPCQPELTAKDIPTPIQNESFMADVRGDRLTHSDDPQDRLFRAHGELSIDIHCDASFSFAPVSSGILWLCKTYALAQSSLLLPVTINPFFYKTRLKLTVK